MPIFGPFPVGFRTISADFPPYPGYKLVEDCDMPSAADFIQDLFRLLGYDTSTESLPEDGQCI